VFCLLSVCLSDYVIKDSTFGSGSVLCSRKQLINSDTNEYVSIVLEYGGMVDDVVLLSPVSGKLKPVIASSGGDCQFIADNPHFQGKQLLPYANRIANATYVWNGTRYYLPLNEPDRNNSIHGLLYNVTVFVESQEALKDRASLVVGYEFNSSYWASSGYPFNLSIRINYTLSALGFDVNVTATNVGKQWSAPFFNSWHPYFLANVSSAYLIFDPCTQWNHVDVYNNSNLYSNLLPTGRTTDYNPFDGSSPIGGTDTAPTYYDDEFKPRKRCGSKGKERPGLLPAFHQRLKDSVSGDTSVLWHEAEKYPFVQVYTGARSNWGLNAVALEPMAAEMDAFNNFDSLKILSGGETWSGTYGVYLE